MAKHSRHLLELAKRGAELQLRDILHEARLLFGLFPHLRDTFDRDEMPLTFLMAEDSGALNQSAAPGARRKPRSAASRKAASKRMKKYWAAKRKNSD